MKKEKYNHFNVEILTISENPCKTPLFKTAFCLNLFLSNPRPISTLSFKMNIPCAKYFILNREHSFLQVYMYICKRNL